jgi:light-regulated signal transduction histidine kinase (bacteriophytochrome)
MAVAQGGIIAGMSLEQVVADIVNIIEVMSQVISSPQFQEAYAAFTQAMGQFSSTLYGILPQIPGYQYSPYNPVGTGSSTNPADNAAQKAYDILVAAINKQKDLLQKQEPSDLPRTQNLIPSIIEIIEEKRLSLTALKQIEIDFDYSCSSPAYVTIEGFKRVLSNLLNNSIEAIQDQGRISISLVENDEHSVKLCIADNGCGMDASILEMIGRPGKSFGKSDRPQQGGFGIAHARQTIESWNGQLSIKSYPGTGTTIEIVIRKSAPSARLA